MSNEELVAEIQTGRTELVELLWENVEKLISWRAHRFLSILSATGLCHGVEIGDLINTGYFAVLAAVKTYDPEKGKFSSWLILYLKNAFAEATGYRTEKQRGDPLRYALSMDAPLEDEDGDTVGDLQADPAATIPFENVDDAIFYGQLRQALEKAISELPATQAEVIRRRYWDRQTLEEIGEAIGKSTERIRQLEDNAILAMRMPPHSNQLETFVEQRTPYYLHIGSREFQRTHTSATEKIVFLREKLKKEGKWKYDSKRMVKPVSGTTD